MGGWARRGDMLGIWILAMLLDAPLHGYEILQRAQQHPAWRGINPGGIYRVLRELEMEGFVVSTWSMGGGPPRRVYRITDKGKGWLCEMKGLLLAQRAFIDELIKKIEGGV